MPLGCVGYVEAAIELAEQVGAGELPEPSHIVVALGSGGTAAGLLAGLKLAGLRSRLVCVLVNDLIRVDDANRRQARSSHAAPAAQARRRRRARSRSPRRR